MNPWDDQQAQSGGGKNNQPGMSSDPNERLREVDQQLKRAGVDLNLTGALSGNYQPTRTRGGCGIFGILTVLSFVLLFGFVFGVILIPELTKAISPVFCPTNSTLKIVEGSSDIDGTEIFFHCLDAEGTMVEDASLKMLVAIFALAALPFLFIILIAVRTTRRNARIASEYIPAMTAALQARAVPMNTYSAVSMGGSTAGNTKERLQKLQEMYDGQLITKEEYDRKRAEILKSL
jgi:glucan phosphoethanolaminetransferase (alkaline phosphatase superfamily)